MNKTLFLSFLLGLCACTTEKITSAPSVKVVDSSELHCFKRLRKIRTIIDSDYHVGNLSRYVYDPFVKQLSEVETLCKSGKVKEGLLELNKYNVSHGYPENL